MCVFIGYSLQHLGYKCLHIPTGRVYVARNVIFDELLFPFVDYPKSTTQQVTHT